MSLAVWRENNYVEHMCRPDQAMPAPTRLTLCVSAGPDYCIELYCINKQIPRVQLRPAARPAGWLCIDGILAAADTPEQTQGSAAIQASGPAGFRRVSGSFNRISGIGNTRSYAGAVMPFRSCVYSCLIILRAPRTVSAQYDVFILARCPGIRASFFAAAALLRADAAPGGLQAGVTGPTVF